MLLGSTLQDALVFLAASLATAFPIYSVVPMPQQEQLPGPELGKGRGAPCAHPGERRPRACSGLLEPNPRALPGPRPQRPGGFLLSRRHLPFAVPPAPSCTEQPLGCAGTRGGCVSFPLRVCRDRPRCPRGSGWAGADRAAVGTLGGQKWSRNVFNGEENKFYSVSD